MHQRDSEGADEGDQKDYAHDSLDPEVPEKVRVDEGRDESSRGSVD
jgi:hypothetical protein